MTLAFRYLGGELVRAYLLVAVALVTLFDLIAFLTEAEDIGDARYGVIDAAVVVVWSTPALLVDLAPFVVLLATLNAFANLDARTEITALRTAGTSRAWFVGTTAVFAIAWMSVMVAVEWVARPLHLEASLLRMYETARTGNPLEGTGFWTRTADTIVNVGSLRDTRARGDVRIFTLSDGRLVGYERAATAEAERPGRWRLNGVVRRTVDGNGPVGIERLEDVPWTPVWAFETDVYSLTVASVALVDLWRRGDEEPTYHVELWRRIVLPLSGIAYGVLAAGYALGGRGRGGKALRMVIGVAAALALYLAEQLVVNAGILAGLPVALVSLLPPLVVFALAAALVRRAV